MSHPEQAEACRTEGSEAADPLLHPDACLGDEMRRAGCFGSHKKFLSPFFRSDLGDKGPPFKGVPFRWSARDRGSAQSEDRHHPNEHGWHLRGCAKCSWIADPIDVPPWQTSQVPIDYALFVVSPFHKKCD